MSVYDWLVSSSTFGFILKRHFLIFLLKWRHFFANMLKNRLNAFLRTLRLPSSGSLSLQWQLGDLATISARLISTLFSESDWHSDVKESDLARCCWNRGSSNCSRVKITQLLSWTNSSRESPRKFLMVVNANNSLGSGTGTLELLSGCLKLFRESNTFFFGSGLLTVWSDGFAHFPRNNFLNHFMTDNFAVFSRLNEWFESRVSHSHNVETNRCFHNERWKATVIRIQYYMIKKFAARPLILTITKYTNIISELML